MFPPTRRLIFLVSANDEAWDFLPHAVELAARDKSRIALIHPAWPSGVALGGAGAFRGMPIWRDCPRISSASAGLARSFLQATSLKAVRLWKSTARQPARSMRRFE